MIRRAGLTRWPRPFHNLHASRPTELADQFPLHVVTDWIGNSPDVADRHYLKTTEDHFQRAVGGNADSAVKERRPTVGAATAQNGLKGLAKTQTAHRRKVSRCLHLQFLASKMRLPPPRGVKPPAQLPGKTPHSQPCGAQNGAVAARGQIDERSPQGSDLGPSQIDVALVVVIQAWPHLPAAIRKGILAMVRAAATLLRAIADSLASFGMTLFVPVAWSSGRGTPGPSAFVPQGFLITQTQTSAGSSRQRSGRFGQRMPRRHRVQRRPRRPRAGRHRGLPDRRR